MLVLGGCQRKWAVEASTSSAAAVSCWAAGGWGMGCLSVWGSLGGGTEAQWNGWVGFLEQGRAWALAHWRDTGGRL